MNERLVLLCSLIVAEFGGPLLSLLVVPQELQHVGSAGLTEVLASHLEAVAAAWASIAVLTWALAPEVWRIRQGRASKLRVLACACAVGLVIEDCTLLSVDVAAFLAQAAGRHGLRPSAVLLVLADRSAGFLGLFWVTVWIFVEVDRRRVPVSTPAPRFGRD